MKTLLAIFVGGIAGLFLGTFGLYCACALFDWIFDRGGGSDLVAVGWVFMFLMAPLGLLLGAVMGGFFSRRSLRKKKAEESGNT